MPPTSARPSSFPVPPSAALYQFVFLHVKSRGGCHRRQLACLMHMIEVLAIYNIPARATDLTYLKPAPLPMLFHSANEDEGCRLGHFVKSRGTITNLHYPSFCRAWSFSPGAKLLQRWLSSTCLSISHTREAHRGVVITKGQFVILVSLHHRSHYLGLLSIKKKLLMWARKCVLCHYAAETIDFTLDWF